MDAMISNAKLRALAEELGVDEARTAAAIALLDEGNTIPFIARYRKERTGGLDEEQLRRLAEAVAAHRTLEVRREEVLRLLRDQGQLTPELEEAVRAAENLRRLDDLYRPYRPKRTTRASIARERGLEPLADWLLTRSPDPPEAIARRFLSADVTDVAGALQGARDILAERLSDDPELRERLRRLTWRTGVLSVRLLDTERADHYRAYDGYTDPVDRVPPHRILAINRGEREKALRVEVHPDVERCIDACRQALFGTDRAARRLASPADAHLELTAADAYKRFIAPSLEREVRHELTARAEEQALRVFRLNLRNLLLQPPLRNRVVMGLDPGFRTGVKVAVVDPTGRLLATGVIYPTAPHRRGDEAMQRMDAWTDRYRVDAVAIGNGTASRETEAFVVEWLRRRPPGARPGYAIVDEAGASVYSASPLARAEFPDLDVSERSAVSIARRLQDPLAELVKIEPRSLGVGQYQHDIDPKRLDEVLRGVVEDAVNHVGVDLNTASVQLLSYVAGLTPAVAAKIVARREEQGPFRSRRELLQVKRLGPRTFEQCAGFLRIPDAAHPFDRTSIHPESYAVAERLLQRLGLDLADLVERPEEVRRRCETLDDAAVRRFADELQTGEPTLRDIITSLMRPGRDPREDLPPPRLRSDVLAFDDLRIGMQLEGTVRNVVDFGAFVDIGVGEDGLIHVSQLADRYVKHPSEVVSVGQPVRVRVIELDPVRRRIGLSLRGMDE